MEEPRFINHLTAIFKMIIFLDIHNKRFHNFLVLIKFLTQAFFFLSTTLCMKESIEFNDVTFTKLHDIFFMIGLSVVEAVMLPSKTAKSSLIEFVSGPLKSFEKNTVHSKIVKDHNKEVNMYCTLLATICSICVLSFSLASAVFSYVPSNNIDGECSRVVVGWVSNSDFYFGLLLLNTVSFWLFYQNQILWNTSLLCSVIRIKYKCRLLCASLDAIDGFMCKSQESLESHVSSVKVQTDPTSMALSSSHDKEAKTLKGNEMNYTHSMNTQVQKCLKERQIKEQCALCIKDLVDQHLNIIKYVKMTDKNFRHMMMFFLQSSVIIVALAIPKLSSIEDILRTEYITRVMEVMFAIVICGFYNYLGQIVLDETESLRQALYNCDWTDKPHSLKKGLIIMQIVANKPVKLTIGGIYTLSIETYTKFLGATHSYTSVIQSLNSNG